MSSVYRIFTFIPHHCHIIFTRISHLFHIISQLCHMIATFLRNYYYLQGVGRITIDENIEFFPPDKCYHNSKKIDKTVMEIKIQKNKFDKNSIEKVINFRESRFSKYCTGVSCLFK